MHSESVALHFNISNLYYPLQSGFCPGYSTMSTLLNCTDSSYDSLDVSKVFDMVNHNLLLSKLQSLGLDSSAVAWLHSYLQDRSMFTYLDNVLALLLCLSLFSTFIKDFLQTTPSSTTVVYADDTPIYVSGTDVEEISPVLQSCLDTACLWM